MSGFFWTLPANANQQVSSVQQQQAILLGKDILFVNDYAVTAARDYVLVAGLEALKHAINRRLITRQGQFRARPEYGVGIMDFVKKRNTLATLDELRQRTGDQLSLDPRISEVVDVVVEPITDGLKLGVIVQAAGKTLRFEPFNFRETMTIGTLGVPEGVGIRIVG